MSNYHTYSDYKMRQFFGWKAFFTGAQVVFGVILVIAALAFSGFNPLIG